MEVTLTTIDRFSFNDKDSHILTYAEEGFAPLSIYSKPYVMDSSAIKKFAETVNQRDVWNTLFPTAPISAIPSRLIRKYCLDVKPSLRAALNAFLDTDQTRIRATTIILDFDVPHVSDPIFRAVVDFFESQDCPELKEVMLIDTKLVATGTHL